MPFMLETKTHFALNYTYFLIKSTYKFFVIKICGNNIWELNDITFKGYWELTLEVKVKGILSILWNSIFWVLGKFICITY